MLADFKRFIRANLCQASFSNLIGNIEVIDLDSSTEEKFSHHLIVNLYCKDSSPVFFANNLEVGKFVHALIEKMKANGTLVLSPSLVFVDDAVYTKNRNFRTFLSSKFGKRATLRRSEQYSDDEDASTLHHLSEQEFFFKVSSNFLIDAILQGSLSSLVSLSFIKSLCSLRLGILNILMLSKATF